MSNALLWLWRVVLAIVAGIKTFRGPGTAAALREKDYQERHAAWAKELKELEDAEKADESAWRKQVVTNHPGVSLLELQARWDEAAKAVGTHRGREPHRTPDRTE